MADKQLKLANTVQDTIKSIEDFLGYPADLKILRSSSSDAGEWTVLYLQGLVNEDQLVTRVSTFCSTGEPRSVTDWAYREERGIQEALTDLSKGHALLLSDFQQRITLFNLPVPGWELRAIAEPTSEQLIRGPREGFTETIAVNTAMIRRWISDSHLRVDEFTVGIRTTTAVRILYLDNVANPALVKEAKKRISAIGIDGVLSSGYIEQLITDRRLTVFPLIQSTERSDSVTAAILEGRVAILVDKSPFALIIPTTINELYQSPEDYYFSPYLGSFLRIIRLLGNNLAVGLPGLYVALCSVNPELLPTSLAFSISESRRGIPYPLFIEVLALELTVETFREAGQRLPKTVNQTLGIVAGVALAFAAVQAHLVSGSSLVVVAIAAIASYSAPSFSVDIPWRIFKYLLIIGAAALGVVGLTLVGILILAHAATLSSFGTSYLAPWAPLYAYDLLDSFIRIPLWLRFRRPEAYHSEETQRMGNTRDDLKEGDNE